MNIRPGLMRVAVTLGVLLAIPSFFVGTALYKTRPISPSYLVLSPWDSLKNNLDNDKATLQTGSRKLKNVQNRNDTPPHTRLTLPVSVGTELSIWKSLIVGFFTALGGFIAVVVAICLTTEVVMWICEGFRSEKEFDDPVLENKIDISDLVDRFGHKLVDRVSDINHIHKQRAHEQHREQDGSTSRSVDN